MQLLLPPELSPYSSALYYKDLSYREEIDNENMAERQLRLALLFNPDITYEIDY